MTLHSSRVASTFAWCVVALTVAACGPEVREGDAEAVAPGAATDEPQDPRVVAADLSRIKGDTSATVWLVMASDFQCPACKYWHDNHADAIMRDYVDAGRVRFAYINFPLSQHLNARPAAEAAMCAGAQSKFWDMHDRIFAAQSQWAALTEPVAHLRQLAAGVGVDLALWDSCMADDIMLPMIDGDFNRGNAGGVNETPTFFVGSQMVAGAVPASQLRPLLDNALARAGGGGAGGAR